MGQNVGIGTATPAYPLHVIGNVNLTGSILYNGVAIATGTGSIWNPGSGGVAYYNGGFVAIGTVSPLARFTIRNGYSDGDTGGLCIDSFDGSVYNMRLSTFVQGSGQVGYRFGVNNQSAAYPNTLVLGHNGNVGIGMTLPAYSLDVNGTARIVHCSSDLLIGWSTAPSGNQYNDVGTNNYAGISLRGSGNASSVMCATTYVPFVATKYGTSPSQMMVFAYASAIGVASSTIGSITHTTTTVAYNTTSDSRLKENIEDVSDIRGMIDRLRPRTFTFIGDERKDLQIGFIAQEVREYYPHYVAGTETEREFLGMDYGKMSPFAIAACKDLYLKHDALTSQVATQASTIATLEAQASNITTIETQASTIAALEAQVASLSDSLAGLLTWAQAQGFSG
jgi:hypothetical protein